MGNSYLASRCHLPEAPSHSLPSPGAEGVLGRVQGQYIASALELLPDAGTTAEIHQEVEIDAGPAGKVRIFIERKRVRHHRHSHYFWSAYRAEPVVEDSPL